MLASIRKAIVSGLMAAVGATGTAMLDGYLTDRELLAAWGAGMVAAAATWAIPNRQQPRATTPTRGC